MLHLMTQAYRLNDTFGEVWYLPLADDGAAVAATGTVAVHRRRHGQRHLYLYVGGVRYRAAGAVHADHRAAGHGASRPLSTPTPNLPGERPPRHQHRAPSRR
jgi:phage tail sheath gpL-like